MMSTFVSCLRLELGVSLPVVLKGLYRRPVLAYLCAMGAHLYAAFAFVGFVLCAIPFYWHLHGSCDIFDI